MLPEVHSDPNTFHSTPILSIQCIIRYRARSVISAMSKENLNNMTWLILRDSDAAVINEIDQERPRRAALIAGAFVELRLEETIKSYLREDKKIAPAMFKGMGALATFSAKIDLGYLMKLYPGRIRQLLHGIRDIRNDFAHETQPINFDTQSVRDRCRNLVAGLERMTGEAIFHTSILHKMTGKTKLAIGGPKLPDGEFSLIGIDSPRAAYIAAVKLALFILDMVTHAYPEERRNPPIDLPWPPP